MNEWISVKEKPYPVDQEFLCIWKGRIGIGYKDSETGKFFCAMCPYEYTTIANMDEECEARIKLWMPLPLSPSDQRLHKSKIITTDMLEEMDKARERGEY